MSEPPDRRRGHAEPPNYPSSKRRTSSGLAAGAGAVLFILVAGAGVRFLLQVGLGRWAGASEFGLYGLAWTWAFLLALVAGLGLPVVVLRLVPEFLARSEWGRLAALLRTSRRAVMGAGVGIAAALALAVAIWPGTGRASEVVALGGWLIPVIALVELQTEMLRGAGRMISAYTPPQVARPALTLAAAAVVAGLGDLRAEAILALIGLALLLTAAYQALRLRQVLPQAMNTAVPATDPREWKGLAGPLFLVSAFQMVLAQSDVLIVGMWRPADDIGVYLASARTAALVGFVLAAVNAVAAPRIAAAHARDDRGALRRLARQATRWMFWPSLGACLALALLAEPVLGLFGGEFVRGAGVLRILLIGHLVSAAAGPVAYLLMMTGRERRCARALGWSAVVHVVLNVWLVSRLGLTGAAVATAASMVVWNGWLSVLVYRHLGLRPALGWLPGPRDTSGRRSRSP